MKKKEVKVKGGELIGWMFATMLFIFSGFALAMYLYEDKIITGLVYYFIALSLGILWLNLVIKSFYVHKSKLGGKEFE